MVRYNEHSRWVWRKKKNLAAPPGKLKLGRRWIFQDNDPIHTSKSTQKWVTEHKIKLLPSQSPDLNLWVELKRESAHERT